MFIECMVPDLRDMLATSPPIWQKYQTEIARGMKDFVFTHDSEGFSPSWEESHNGAAWCMAGVGSRGCLHHIGTEDREREGIRGLI